jgi:hypothetical protein
MQAMLTGAEAVAEWIAMIEKVARMVQWEQERGGGGGVLVEREGSTDARSQSRADATAGASPALADFAGHAACSPGGRFLGRIVVMIARKDRI